MIASHDAVPAIAPPRFRPRLKPAPRGGPTFRMIFVTIATLGFLPRAAALARSIAAVHPGARLVLALVDRVAGRADLSRWPLLDVHEIESFGIDGLDAMMARYDVVEFATAVKPFVMQRLFERFPDESIVAYVDPDLFVYRPLDSIGTEIGGGSILLTPHFLAPFSDGMKPTETTALAFGVFNLGFIAATRCAETDAVLDWWSDRLREGCRRRGERGMYTDQLWMNLAPVYFRGTRIWRHPGANAAWWNLHERRIERGARALPWMCNGEPLLFYHFSKLGVRGDDRIAAPLERYTFTARPELRPLYEEYHAALEAEGQGDLAALPCLLPLRTDAPGPGRTLVSRILRRIAR